MAPGFFAVQMESYGLDSICVTLSIMDLSSLSLFF